MADIQQNTLYLTTHGSYVARDHLTLQVEVPVYPEDLPREERSRERASDWRKLSIPIHMLESICVFGAEQHQPAGAGFVLGTWGGGELPERVRLFAGADDGCGGHERVAAAGAVPRRR